MLEGGRKCREVANVGSVYVQTAYFKYFRLSHAKIGAVSLETLSVGLMFRQNISNVFMWLVFRDREQTSYLMIVART